MRINVFFPGIGLVETDTRKLRDLRKGHPLIAAGTRIETDHVQATVKCHNPGEACKFKPSRDHEPEQTTVTIRGDNNTAEALEEVKRLSGLIV